MSLAVCPHNGCGFSGRKALGENNRCTFDYGLPFEFLKKRIDIAAECVREGLSSSADDYLENHAISVTSGITDRRIRALHLMYFGAQ